MEHRRLGKEGDTVSVIGLGAWPLGGGMGHIEEQTVIATIRRAIDLGITLIDTAQGYMTSEASLGKALKDGYRDRSFLATKVSGKYSRQDIISAMDNSLKALDVDYVDLYQIHSWNPKYPIEESMETMLQLQQEGKTRFIGVSNFNADQMRQALDVGYFHSNQPRYNMFDRELEAKDMPFCEEHEIGILAHSALAKGLLTGKYTPDSKLADDDERNEKPRFQGDTFGKYLALAERLRPIAEDKGLTMVQLALAWCLRKSAVTCVLVGAKSTQQVEEHVGAVGVTFTDDELSRIDAILADQPAV